MSDSKITGNRNEVTVVVNTDGKGGSGPGSAGVPVTVVKNSGGQVVSVHGTTAGVVFDFSSK